MCYLLNTKTTLFMNIIKNKINHCADIHIESTGRREKEYKYIYEKVIENIKNDDKLENSIMIVVGDVMDFKYQSHPIGIEQMIYFFKVFSEYMPILFCAGQHDVCIDDVNNQDWLSLVKIVYSEFGFDMKRFGTKKKQMVFTKIYQRTN